MLKEYASPLTLELKPSAALNAFLWLIHALATSAVLLAQIHWAVQIIFVALIIIYFNEQKRAVSRYQKLIWFDDNHWHIYADGQYTEACLTPMSFHSSWLVILVFKTASGKTVNALLLYDVLDADVFRRLKVRLTILNLKDLLNQSLDE